MRLKRKYQNYKGSYYLEAKRDPFSLYPDLFTVDYQLDDCRSLHVADMSFTFLHWKIIEEINENPKYIDLIDNQQMELLCFNILPGGDTILHKLFKLGEVIAYIYKTAQPNEEDVSKDMAF